MNNSKRPLKMILVGAGGFAEYWIGEVLPTVKDVIEVVAVCDKNSDVLKGAGAQLGIPDDRLFSDASQAFNGVKADMAGIIVPAAFHSAIAREAMEKGFNVLSEKPMTDSMPDCVALERFARGRQEKLAVTMSRSFEGGKPALIRLLREERYGKLNYITMRLDTQKLPTAIEMHAGHALGIKGYYAEGVIHAVDLVINMAGAPAKRVFSDVWRPEWEWRGYPIDMSGFTSFEFENGVRAVIEQSQINASSLDDWGSEYVRAECENATVILRGDSLEARVGSSVEKIAIENPHVPGHARLIRAYADWLQNGGDFSCSASHNLETCAATFASVESAESGRPVAVGEFLSRWEGKA